MKNTTHLEWMGEAETEMIEIIKRTAVYNQELAVLTLLTALSAILKENESTSDLINNLMAKYGLFWLWDLLPEGHPAKPDIEQEVMNISEA